MKRRGLLTIRVNQLMRFGADSARDDARGDRGARASTPDEGDEWVRVGGMKLGVDGGFEGGWMRQPYAEPWGEGGTFFGVNTMKQAPYTDVVKELNRLGWRVATHAVGDAAIDEVLAAYEAAERREVRSPAGGGRIEHGFIPQADQFPRMKKLELVISAQDHLYLAGPSLVNYWGPARAARTTPMRAYLDRGLRRRRRHRLTPWFRIRRSGSLSLRHARHDQRRRARRGSEDHAQGSAAGRRPSTTPI